MNAPTQPILLAVVLGYLLFLFLVASLGETFAARLRRGRVRTLTYVLAASVYCTAWTFYGSVGLAANRGLEFLTIYLGPALRRADLARAPAQARPRGEGAADHRRSRTSSPAATASRRRSARSWRCSWCAGMIPYIALQLKAVSASFRMMIADELRPRVLRPDAARGGDARRLRHPLRRAQPRLHQAADRAHDGGRGRVAGQAGRVPRGRRLRHVGPLRRLRRHLHAGVAAIRSGAAPRPSGIRPPPRTRAGSRCCWSR